MEVKPESLDREQNYRTLRNLVIPRPVILVSTINKDGLVNVAPFSFFGVVSTYPPVVGIAIGQRYGKEKDTLKNIRSTKELVINLVTEDMAEKVNITGIPFPPEVCELEPSGLCASPSAVVRPPRVAESPAHLECSLMEVFDIGKKEDTYSFVMAKVLLYHVENGFWQDEFPDSSKFKVLGRFGNFDYFGIKDTFTMKRIRYEDWLSEHKQSQ